MGQIYLTVEKYLRMINQLWLKERCDDSHVSSNWVYTVLTRGSYTSDDSELVPER